MNKMLKGAIAISASALLLVGGGGTLAVWNTTPPVWGEGAAITTGSMTLATSDGTWTRGPENTPIRDITSYPVVPGEKLTFTQKLTVNLKGNFVAGLSVTDDSYRVFNRADLIVHSATLTTNELVQRSANFLVYGESLSLKSDVAGKSYTVDGHLVFEFSDTLASEGTTVDLSKVEFKLFQESYGTGS